MRRISRRLSFLTQNLFNIQMSGSSWLVTGVALLLAIACFLSVYWLDEAVKKTAACTPIDPPIDTFGGGEIVRHEVDAVLINDFSGSMDGVSGSDPDSLRFQAAELMVSLLAADIYPRTTNMGYVIFSQWGVSSYPLSAIDQGNHRENLISVLSETPEGITSDDWYDYTNIASALDQATSMLFTDGKRKSQNTPAIILLTDGEPTRGVGGDSEVAMETQVLSRVKDLTLNGVNLFVVILRNPVNIRRGTESERLTYWRNVWAGIANTNARVQYVEAQNASELEGIYNNIRSRLVSEGAPPGERQSYNPNDPNASIQMPPNLVLAHLLVALNNSSVKVDLVAPDGTSFEQIKEQDSKNNLLVGQRYYRYQLYRPSVNPSNRWTLSTNSAEPLHYVLNVTSLYNVRVAWPSGSYPYIHPTQKSQLPLVVMNSDDGQISTKPFTIEASVIKTVSEEGSFVEKQITLDTPVLQPDGKTYILYVDPKDLSDQKTLDLQLSGKADDGSVLNMERIKIPVATAPEGLEVVVKTDGEVVAEDGVLECTNEKLILYPPQIQCNNIFEVDAEVGKGIIPGTLVGELYPPCDLPTETMQSEGDTLRGTLGPLTAAGEFPYGMMVTGNLPSESQGDDELNQANNLLWKRWANGVVKITWPSWVAVYRERLYHAGILLAFCALWKPVIVALLLLLFGLLKVAPSGRATAEPQPDMSGTSIYQEAMKHRKLFAVTVGRTSASDFRRSDGVHPHIIRHWYAFPVNALRQWIGSQPGVRFVAVPWLGIWIEDDSGFTRADNNWTPASGYGGTLTYYGRQD